MRGAAAMAVLIVAAACSGGSRSGDVADLNRAIADASPGDRIELSAGSYDGPVVIDKPLTIAARPGAVLSAPAGAPALYIVDVDGVEVSGLTIEGGDAGVSVRRATSVVLDGLTIHGPRWHGIFAHDAEVVVRGCRITGLVEPLGQGVEIINSDSREPSLVEGCTIEGPVYEGVVSHVSQVTFRDNVVTGSTERGIVVTEMSSGRIEGNRVSDAVGSAYFCGDRSMCSVVDNDADGVHSEGIGFRSSDGNGLVVHFRSQAFVDDLRVEDADGEDLLTLLDGALVDVSLYP